MAAKQLPYFKHDFNASEDEKMYALRADYGWTGSGWWWYIVECLRAQEGYKIDLSNKILVGRIVAMLGISKDEFHSFINNCANEYGLLTIKDNVFWSNSLNSRMNAYETKIESKRTAGKLGAEKRWNSKEKKNDGKTSENDSIPIKSNSKQPKSNGKQNPFATENGSFATENHSYKKRKEKKRKEKKRPSEKRSLKPATPEEVSSILGATNFRKVAV